MALRRARSASRSRRSRARRRAARAGLRGRLEVLRVGDVARSPSRRARRPRTRSGRRARDSRAGSGRRARPAPCRWRASSKARRKRSSASRSASMRSIDSASRSSRRRTRAESIRPTTVSVPIVIAHCIAPVPAAITHHQRRRVGQPDERELESGLAPGEEVEGVDGDPHVEDLDPQVGRAVAQGDRAADLQRPDGDADARSASRARDPQRRRGRPPTRRPARAAPPRPAGWYGPPRGGRRAAGGPGPSPRGRSRPAHACVKSARRHCLGWWGKDRSPV